MTSGARPTSPAGTSGTNGADKPQVASLVAVSVEDLADRRSVRYMREIIAMCLLGLLFGLVALAFIALLADTGGEAADKRFAHLKSLLDVLVGPLITLASSAIGFYFGTQVSSPRTGGSGGDR